MLALFTTNVYAATVTVGPGQAYTTIQAAINNAGNGDTILVYYGTYTENLVVNKSVTIRGIRSPGGKPIISPATSIQDSIRVSADGACIEGFNITYQPPVTGGYPSVIIVSSNDCAIRDNDIGRSPGSAPPSRGIYVEDSYHNATIINNNISGSYNGMEVRSVGSVVANNRIVANQDGLEVINSHDTAVSNNTITGSAGSALTILTSSDCRILNNDLHDSTNGIYIHYGSACNISGNNIRSNGYGFYIASDSGNNLIYRNNIIDNVNPAYSITANKWNSTFAFNYRYHDTGYTSNVGNYWSNFVSPDLDGNGIRDREYRNITIDYYPLASPIEDYCLLNETGLVTPPPNNSPTNNSTVTVGPSGRDYTGIQDALDNVPDGGTVLVYPGTYAENLVANKRVTIRGIGSGGNKPVIMPATSAQDGIAISGDGVRIEGFNITYQPLDTNGGASVILVASNDCAIRDNDIGRNPGSPQPVRGIYVEDSYHNTTIDDNSISGAYIGMEVRSVGSVVANNRVVAYQDGLEVINSHDTAVSNNTITGSAGSALSVLTSSDCLIRNNVLSDSTNGIYVQYGSSCNISRNSIRSNGRGIYFDSGSGNNLVYYNDFIDNTDPASSMAVNKWNSSVPVEYWYRSIEHTGYVGNYWGNYTGIDPNNDGVGNSSYVTGNVQDSYPLMDENANYLEFYPVLDAAVVSNTIPEQMAAGECYNISVIMKNNGTLPWSEAESVRLLVWGDTAALGVTGDCDNYGCGYPEYAIAQGTTVAPDSSYTFNFSMTPSSAGSFLIGLTMARNGEGTNITGFGTPAYVAVTVSPPPFNESTASAVLVSVEAPDTVMLGHTYTGNVTFMNTGPAAWDESSLVRMLVWGSTAELGITGDAYNYGCGYEEFQIPAGTSVQPGENYTWSFSFTPVTAGYTCIGLTMAHNRVDGSVVGFGQPTFESIIVTPASFDIAYGNAWYQSNTVPSTMRPAQTYNVSVTFMNDGWAPWSEADQVRLLVWGDTDRLGILGDCDNYSCGYPEYALPPDEAVLLWQDHTFDFTIRPTSTGTYTIGFAMAKNNGSDVTAFGGYGYAVISVESSIGSVPLVIPPYFNVSGESAAYISDDMPETMVAGHTYPVNITFYNNGSCPWIEADNVRLLAFGDAAALGMAGDCDNYGCGYPEYSMTPGSLTYPNNTTTWSFNVAPASAGTYTLGFTLAQNEEGTNVTAFGEARLVNVNVY